MTTFYTLYIDPGTGSMLFSLLLGLATTAVFGIRALALKMKFAVGRGKKTELDSSVLPVVIFTDSKRYWSLFKPILDEFEKRESPIVYYTQDDDDPALTWQYKFVKAEFIGHGNVAFAKMNMLKANICLSSTPGLDVYQWKRSKNVKCYVHIPHAVDEFLGYRMFGIDYYDAILLTGEFQEKNIRKLENLRNLPAKELVTVGYPLMDSAFQKFNERNSQNQPLLTKEEISCPTVLVAPSWGTSAILSRYGEKFLKALSQTGFKIIVRPHPQTKTSESAMLESLMKKFPEQENFSWNFDNDNFDCMNKADILITDFSGIIFDFAFIFNKPLIYADTSFDDSIYDAAWIKDEPLWRFEVLKELGIKLQETDFENISTIIQETIKSDTFANGRKKAREQAWQYQGEGAIRIADYLIEKQENLLCSLKGKENG